MCPTAVALLMSMADAVQHLKEGDKKLKPPPDDATIAEKLRLDEMAPQDSGFWTLNHKLDYEDGR